MNEEAENSILQRDIIINQTLFLSVHAILNLKNSIPASILEKTVLNWIVQLEGDTIIDYNEFSFNSSSPKCTKIESTNPI